MATSVNDWFDVRDGGAKGDRVTDDTAAIQTTIDNCIAAGGGVVHFPGGTNGHYRTTAPLTATTSVPLTFLGDNVKGNWGDAAGVSAICADFAPASATSPTYTISITNGGNGFCMSNMLLLADANNSFGSSATEYAGLYTDGLPQCIIQNCGTHAGSAATSFNSGFELYNNITSTVQNCSNIAGANQAIWMKAGSGLLVDGCNGLGSTAGNGGAAIVMDNGAGTIRLRNSVTIQGDRGFLARGAAPTAFIFVYGYEVNNPAICGMEFQTGNEVWLDQFWITGSGRDSSSPRYAINCNGNFRGDLNATNCQFGQVPGHGVWLQSGSGYSFTGCQFGNSGNNASNTYNDLHIGANVSNVTVTGCSFGTTPFLGLAPQKARSAIFIENGAQNVTITGNQFASGYGAGVVLDNANAVTGSTGNSGWKPAMQSDTGGDAVEGNTYAQLSGAFNIDAYEATIGDTYRLVAWGHGTQASPAPADLDIQGIIGASPMCFTIMNGSTMGAGNGFHWKAVIDMIVTAVGTQASVSAGLNFTWSVASTASNAATASGDNTTLPTFNAQTGNTVYFAAKWSSASGSPTLTCEGSYLQCMPG